jgi:hypothetical protein
LVITTRFCAVEVSNVRSGSSFGFAFEPGASPADSRWRRPSPSIRLVEHHRRLRHALHDLGRDRGDPQRDTVELGDDLLELGADLTAQRRGRAEQLAQLAASFSSSIASLRNSMTASSVS